MKPRLLVRHSRLFYYLGEFKTIDEAVEKMVHLEQTFIPNMDNHKRYDILYKSVYKSFIQISKACIKSFTITSKLVVTNYEKGLQFQ